MGRTAGVFKYDDEILRLRQQGLIRADIADRLGISGSTVINCMRRYGIKSIIDKRLSRHKISAPAKSSVGKRPFSILIAEDQEVFRVMPTSREQYDYLLAILQAEGGEII